jgi:hypothetical protein
LGSIPIARSTLRQRQAMQGDRIRVNTLIRWESLGNRRRRGGGLVASRNPALPWDSHAQSHAEVFKNKLCEIPTLPSQQERSQVPGLDLKLPAMTGSNRESTLAEVLCERLAGCLAPSSLARTSMPRHTSRALP